ncbi:glycosyltransferase involved in cell wall biosynthesis [Xenorhabdus cabanillasii]|uniref:Glycosyltransferase involved in cell wall biosynthesis n=1 Tax=Xenorhabdus cabanillasii TaxID=351673 RepID=A0A3D9ULB4_9GAMM|nr:glycosyltransferase [Xenorhabdus cabanillasii]REF25611.1 glycosyltransferase involved in cell wall biosynthesis [Xenorhabdus cabanillasii]
MLELTYAMPCYNHSAFLVEALDSIKNDVATHDLSYEVLIIDDGSLDNSVDVIKKWVETNSDINVRLVMQENHGIAKTVNKLYNNSNGKFVRLSASDDIVLPGSSAAMMAIAADNITCVFGDGIVIDNDSKQVGDSFMNYHGGNPDDLRNNQRIPQKLIDKWCIAGPCILVRRDFFNNYQYDENSRIDDFDFFLNVFKKPDSVIYLDQKVCGYRIHGSNTSKVKDIATRIANLHSFYYLLEKYTYNPELKYVQKKLLAKRYLTKCKINYLQRSYLKAAYHYAIHKYYSSLS